MLASNDNATIPTTRLRVTGASVNPEECMAAFSRCAGNKTHGNYYERIERQMFRRLNNVDVVINCWCS
jgi:hypothetical protein